MKLNQKLIVEMKLHAAAAFPQESCGFLVRKGRKLALMPCQNIASNPQQAFEIHADDWLSAQEQGEIVAVVHSHPDNEPFLSCHDRQAHIQTALPWVLLSGDEVKVFQPVPRLRGRVFEYGKADCAALVRDAYHLMGVDILDEPRADLEADAQQGRLKTKLETEGFQRVDDLQAGDVVLTSHGGQVCHVALYIGDGWLLHHAIDQLSRREPYNRWWQGVTDSVWRHPSVKPEMVQAVLNDVEMLA